MTPSFPTRRSADLRWEIGGWKLRANVDLFYDYYKYIQRLVLLPTVPAATFTTNAAKGDIKGVDVEFVVAPSDMFDVSFQYTYLKTNYKNYIDFIPTPTGLERADLSDSRFPNAPKHQLTITPKITLPVPEAWGTISRSEEHTSELQSLMRNSYAAI